MTERPDLNKNTPTRGRAKGAAFMGSGRRVMTLPVEGNLDRTVINALIAIVDRTLANIEIVCADPNPGKNDRSVLLAELRPGSIYIGDFPVSIEDCNVSAECVKDRSIEILIRRPSRNLPSRTHESCPFGSTMRRYVFVQIRTFCHSNAPCAQRYVLTSFVIISNRMRLPP